MAITKPSWLRTWLDKLNWDILVWRVYVGDAVESGIDWAIGWVNWAIDLGYLAWNKAVAAWDKAVDIFWDLTRRIDWEVDRLLDKITALAVGFKEEWEEKKRWVKEQIEIAEKSIQKTIDGISKSLGEVKTSWENFKRDSLPKLLDFNWVTVFFGKGITKIDDWWIPTKKILEDTAGAITDGITIEVNQITEKLADWGGFFANPWQWLLDRFETWFWGGA